MKIADITQKEEIKDVIKDLKSGRLKSLPDVEAANKALDIKRHDVNDPVIRPNKKVREARKGTSAKRVTASSAEGEGQTREEKVARIAVALQKLIIRRSAAFVFGNPVEYTAQPQNEAEKKVLDILKKILKKAKEKSLNKRAARATFAFKECAELWYPVASNHSAYGQPMKYKLRSVLFSPEEGDTLYPYFDKNRDMVAFSREFHIEENGKSVTCFETYTDEEHTLWKQEGAEFKLVDGYPKTLAIGKIPIIYARQEHFETEDVDSLINRLEFLLSNFADTNDYHSAPKIFVKGKILGFSKKGESGAILEGDKDTEAKYLSWQHAPEAVKLEIETLLKLINMITQNPDISFESVKGLGSISGVALKLLFMDAHLKVEDKLEIFDEFLERRVSILKSFIGYLDTSLEDASQQLEVDISVTPYMMEDEIAAIQKWVEASGGKPVMSQKAAMQKANLVENPEEDYITLQQETSSASMFHIGEPSIE